MPRASAGAATADDDAGQTGRRPANAGPTRVDAGILAWALSVAGIAAVAVLGTSAGVSPLPGHSDWPPYALSVHPPDLLVYGIELLATGAGAFALWRLLRNLAQGWAPSPRRLIAAGLLASSVLLALPPVGSSDVKIYVAYGQEQVEGVNPYLAGPQSLYVRQNDLTLAVEPPWQATPSVYGPAFTAVSAGLASVAHGDDHEAVTLMRLLLTGGFAVTGLLLVGLARSAEERRRAALLWTANPLLLFTLVAGSHVDALVVAVLVVGLLAVRRLPLAAGATVGLAATLKLTGLVALPGLLWARWRRPLPVLAVLAGAVGVAAPWILLTPGAFTQLRHASRFASPAAPWRAMSSVIQPLLGYSAARLTMAAVAGLIGLAVAALLVRGGIPRTAPTPLGRAGGLTAALAVGWVLTATYILPWYDALAWAPLAVAGASMLDLVLVIHTAMLIWAYLPGRDLPLGPVTDTVWHVAHSGLSPATLAVLLVVTVRKAMHHIAATDVGPAVGLASSTGGASAG